MDALKRGDFRIQTIADITDDAAAAYPYLATTQWTIRFTG